MDLVSSFVRDGLARSRLIVQENEGEDGERREVHRGMVANLDRFFGRVYAFYVGNGFTSIILSRVLTIVAFGMFLSATAFLAGFVNWAVLFEDHDLYNSVRGLEGLRKIPIVVYVCLFMCTGYLFVLIARFIYDLPGLLEMRKFFLYSLDIEDIEKVEWNVVVHRLQNLQRSTHFVVAKEELADADISGRILRRDHVLMALLKNNVLLYRIPSLGVLCTFTRTLEWNLRLAILLFVFDSQNGLRSPFLRRGDSVRVTRDLTRRFRLLALINLVLSPFILVFLFVYYFFRYGEEWKSNLEVLGTRQWSPISQWRFREYRELPCVFSRKLNEAYPAAVRYTQQFPSAKTATLGRFLSLVVGGLVALLLVLSTFDDKLLLDITLFGKTLLWYSGVLMGVAAAARAMIPNAMVVHDPIGALGDVHRVLRLTPRSWETDGDSPLVRAEFDESFSPKFNLVIQQILSVMIVDFLFQNLVNDPTLGWVYRYSVPAVALNAPGEAPLPTVTVYDPISSISEQGESPEVLEGSGIGDRSPVEPALWPA